VGRDRDAPRRCGATSGETCLLTPQWDDARPRASVACVDKRRGRRSSALAGDDVGRGASICSRHARDARGPRPRVLEALGRTYDGGLRDSSGRGSSTDCVRPDSLSEEGQNDSCAPAKRAAPFCLDRSLLPLDDSIGLVLRASGQGCLGRRESSGEQAMSASPMRIRLREQVSPSVGLQAVRILEAAGYSVDCDQDHGAERGAHIVGYARRERAAPAPSVSGPLKTSRTGCRRSNEYGGERSLRCRRCFASI